MNDGPNKKMNSYLKNQLEQITVVERNEGMNIQTKHSRFNTNASIYFFFQCSSVIVQEEFCSNILWCIQNPVKHRKWSVLRKQLQEKTLGKDSITFKTLWPYRTLRCTGMKVNIAKKWFEITERIYMFNLFNSYPIISKL